MEANVLVRDAQIFNAAVNSNTISREDSNKDEQRGLVNALSCSMHFLSLNQRSDMSQV